ncbi:MAG: nucleotidyltransferase family protein [Alphaproteobacteria bacterium]
MDRDTALQILKNHKRDLNSLGVIHVSLFGSLARGESTSRSDVDVAVRFAPEVRPTLVRLVLIEQTLADWFDKPVDLIKEPARKPELQSHIERDAIRAF